MPKFPFTNYHELNLDWILKKVDALFNASEENARTIRTYDTRLTAAEQTATSAGTAATAAQQLADAASANADSALSVAGTADSKADSALTAATNAAGAVAGALTAAQEAQQTAASAVATATDAAATASSLESLANTANQNATAALETAQTADQKAVTAQTAAATADQKAVAAQTAATTNAGNITTLQTDVSNLNRQISESITPAIEEIETALDGKAPVIINTASGEIASFSDGADGMLVKSLIANIEPVQDLHGYDYPWPAGGGINKFGDYTVVDGYISGAGVIASAANNKTYIIPIEASTEYSIKITRIVASGSSDNDDAQVGEFYSDSRPVADSTVGTRLVSGGYVTNIFEATFTTSANAKWLAVKVGNTTKTNVEATIATLQVEKGSAVSSTYSPYSNICPISGHTGAEIQGCGKNLVFQKIYGYPNGFNHQIIIDNDTVTGFFWAEKGKMYVRSSSSSSFNRSNVFRLSDQSMHTVVAGELFDEITTDVSNVWTATWSGLTGWYCNSVKDETMFNTLQIEIGSTAASFEEYQGSTLSITFPSEAGTIYGGTLNVTNGVLTVDRVIKSSGWARDRLDSSGKCWLIGNIPQGINFDTNQQSTKAISNIFKIDSLNNVRANNNGIALFGDSAWVGGYSSNPESLDVLLPSLTIVYPLSTPITYQLTESEISGIFETLYGTNNIWTDVGTVNVEYPADTKLYIDGKIAELQALVLEH